MSQNVQPELFYDSYLEALRDDVNAIGGPKALGNKFWPEKDAITARNAVNDRLNAEKRDGFSDEQERYIMRLATAKRGFSAAVCFICDDTGHERPKAKSPEDEKMALQRQVIAAAETLASSITRLERLSQSPLSSVRSVA